MVSLVRTKLTMKSFKGQQQLESHLEAQKQPAHLAKQQWDMLRPKSSAYQAGGHWLAFQMASDGSLEWSLLLYSEVAVRGGTIPCFSSKTAWPSKCMWKPLVLLPTEHPANSLRSELNLQTHGFALPAPWFVTGALLYCLHQQWPSQAALTQPDLIILVAVMVEPRWLWLLWFLFFFNLKPSNRYLADLCHWTSACRHNEHL